MEFQIRPLAVDVDKLDGLSARLVTSHHENNYSGAVKRLNAIRGQLGQLDWATTPVFVVNGLKREELIAANSAFLHELYFDVLGTHEATPPGGLALALQRDFGSIDQWRAEFVAMGKAMGGGSGWVLLSWSSREARLVNHWAADHTHLLAGATPVLALDMYEHAYHLDFGAKAAAYVDAFMKNISWDAVHRRYADAIAADASNLGVLPGSVAASGVPILDVRRQADYAPATQMVEGARWLDPVDVAQWSAELDRAQPVVVHCARGGDVCRSTALALRARGIDARYVVGGFEGWKAAGLPLQPKGAQS